MPTDTTQQTLEAAAHIAKPSGAPPMPTAITPEQPEQGAGGDESTRMAELQFKMEQAQKKIEDKNEKEKISLRGEVERLRQQLEFQKQQHQLDAQQKKNLEEITAREAELRKAEQDIARQQSVAEADIAKRQAEASAELAQERADAMASVADQEAKRYVKMTDDARRSADKYYATQKAKLDKREADIIAKSNAPSAILQDRMDALNNRVKNMTRIRSKLQGTRGVYMDEAMQEKSAADATLQANSAASQAGKSSSAAASQAARPGSAGNTNTTPAGSTNAQPKTSAMDRAFNSRNTQLAHNNAMASSNYANGAPDYDNMTYRDMGFHAIKYKKDAKDVADSGGASANASNMFKSMAAEETQKAHTDAMAKRKAELEAKAQRGDVYADLELKEYNLANTKTYRKEYDKEMSEFDLANMSPEERDKLSKQVANRRQQELKSSFLGGPIDWVARQFALGKDQDGVLGTFQNIARGFAGVAGQDNDANAAYNALSVINPSAWVRKFKNGLTDSYYHTQTSNRLAEAAGVERNWWDKGTSKSDHKKDPRQAALYDAFTEAAANRGIQDTSIAKDVMNWGGDVANLALDVATVVPGVGAAGAALKGARAAQLAAKGVQAANVAAKGVQAANVAAKGAQAATTAARGARAWMPAAEIGTDMGAQAISGALFGPEQTMHKEQLGASYGANSPYWNNANNANNTRRAYLHGANMVQKAASAVFAKYANTTNAPSVAQHAPAVQPEQTPVIETPEVEPQRPQNYGYTPMSPRAKYYSNKALGYAGGNVLDYQFVLNEPPARKFLRRAAPYIQAFTGYNIFTPDTSVLFNKPDPYKRAQIMAGIQNAYDPSQVNRSTGPLTAAGTLYNNQLMAQLYDQHNNVLRNYGASRLGL